MSAYVVEGILISAIVNAAYGCERFYLTHFFDAPNEFLDFRYDQARIGQILLDENYRSVNFRYKEKTASLPYRHDRRTRQLKPANILNFCNTYIYQACEHPEWEKSTAYRLIRWIMDDIIRSLDGYNDVRPWELKAQPIKDY